MAIEQDFGDAQARVKTLPKAPDTETLLSLYALYKQATAGDVEGKRPGMLDLKGRAKYDAWATQKGTARTAAMEQYVALVNRLTKS